MSAPQITSKTGRVFVPCKCKLCGQVIGHYSLEWPAPTEPTAAQSNERQFGLFWEALAKHMTTTRRNDHGAALGMSVSLGGNLTTLMLARHYELPPAAKGFVEEVRGTVHEATRVFRMTDADIDRLVSVFFVSDDAPEEEIKAVRQSAKNMLVSLRDAYEGPRTKE